MNQPPQSPPPGADQWLLPLMAAEQRERAADVSAASLKKSLVAPLKVTFLKGGHNRRTFLVKSAEGELMIAKVARVTGLTQAIRSTFHEANANEFRMLQIARRAGLPVALPLCLAEAESEGARYVALLTKASPLKINVRQWIQKHPEIDSGDRAARSALSTALAALLARWHRAGFVHGDFHLGNVLVNVDAQTPGQWDPLVIDLARARETRRTRPRLYDVAVMLSGAAADEPRTERLRFTRLYAHAMGQAFDPLANRLWRSVQKRHAQLNRQRRRKAKSGP